MLSIDIVGPLPPDHRHEFLIVFVDFFFFMNGNTEGQNVPFLESASLEKRKRSVIKQFYKISKKS